MIELNPSLANLTLELSHASPDDLLRVEKRIFSALHTGEPLKTPQGLRNLYAQCCLELASSNDNPKAYWVDRGLIFGGPFTDSAEGLKDIANEIGMQRAVEAVVKLREGSVNASDEGSTRIDQPLITDHEIPVNDLPVYELAASELSLESFIADHLQRGSPVVIRGLVDCWEACELWKHTEFWKTHFGHRWVPVELGSYAQDGFRMEIMKMEDYVNLVVSKVHTSGGADTAYLAQHDIFSQIPSLEEDALPVPDYCYTGPDGLVKRSFFFSPPSVCSPLHTDPTDNMMCMVVGRKFVKLFPPYEADKLYLKDTVSVSLTSHLPMDLLTNPPDQTSFSRFYEASSMSTILGPGDALFIPKGWFHFVKSLSGAINIAHFFR